MASNRSALVKPNGHLVPKALRIHGIVVLMVSASRPGAESSYQRIRMNAAKSHNAALGSVINMGYGVYKGLPHPYTHIHIP